MKFQAGKAVASVTLFLLATLPLVFGAVHPFIQGLYCFCFMVLSGFYLLSPWRKEGRIDFSRFNFLLVPCVTVALVIIFSIPLPLSIVGILSPNRAKSLFEVNKLAGVDIHAAPVSWNAPASFQWAIYYFSMILLFLLLFYLMKRDRGFIRKLAVLFTVLGVFEAIYGLLQVVCPGLRVLWIPNRYSHAACGSIIYKNQYAAFLNLCWPIAMALAIDYSSRAEKKLEGKLRRFKHEGFLKKLQKRLYYYDNSGLLAWFAAIIIMLSVLFSLSRAGILTMFFIWALLVLLLPFSRKGVLVFLGAALMVLLFYGSMLGFEHLFHRFLSLETSGQDRLHIWTSSLPMLYDYWLTGSGLESYKLLSPVYLKDFPESILWDRAHNEYLQAFIELGVPAGSLLFTWVFYRLLNAFRFFLGARKPEFSSVTRDSLVGIMGLSATAGFLVHGMVDFVWHLPANAFYCTALTAMVHYSRKRMQREDSQAVRAA